MEGIIMRTTGSFYYILGNDNATYTGVLRGKFKMAGLKVTNPIAVGDKVVFEVGKELIVVINQIVPRVNYIIRNSTHKKNQGHLLACNIDLAILVVTLAFPRTSLGFIDRFLVTAEAFRIPVLLLFNKIDLYDDHLNESLKELHSIYKPLGYDCLNISTVTGVGIDELKQKIKGGKNLFSGHSGVGKSTVLNLLMPDLDLRTAEISDFAQKGVHTTTYAQMFQLKEDTFIIDTPGIKELGLNEIENNELIHYFPEMRIRLGKCKFHNCKHLNEPKCAVIESLEKGEIAPSRYESYLSMLENYDNRR